MSIINNSSNGQSVRWKTRLTLWPDVPPEMSVRGGRGAICQLQSREADCVATWLQGQNAAAALSVITLVLPPWSCRGRHSLDVHA